MVWKSGVYLLVGPALVEGRLRDMDQLPRTGQTFPKQSKVGLRREGNNPIEKTEKLKV